MVQRTVRVLIAAIVSVMVVWGGGAAAGALATGTGTGAGVTRHGEPAPVVIPSPERPAGLNVPPTLSHQE